MINVSRPVLPPFEEFVERLRGIWASRQLTNDGPLVSELERGLAEFLGIKHAILVANGTIAIQFAVRAAQMHDSVVTTPFSYVATTSSIAWEGMSPVFADIDADSLTVNPELVDALLSAGATGVVATHVYGNPCDVEALAVLAERHRVPLIFDAAHAFGAMYNGRSVCSYGSAATLSFHATKLFHTVEGGAVVTNDDTIAAAVRLMRNFGQARPDEISALGINGKNSEIHAAMGLCLLPHVASFIRQRALLARIYDDGMAACASFAHPLQWRSGTVPNFSYYPIVFTEESLLLRCIELLSANEIRARRYFRPSLSHLPFVRNAGATPVADSIADRVLCLPLYPDLEPDVAAEIVSLVQSSLA
ncbi:MAG: DegT/DnrJ/EryC1/StrS family aminotransferase [Gemmatimonadaceae bacterium]